jgi:hypothetical protein
MLVISPYDGFGGFELGFCHAPARSGTYWSEGMHIAPTLHVFPAFNYGAEIFAMEQFNAFVEPHAAFPHALFVLDAHVALLALYKQAPQGLPNNAN